MTAADSPPPRIFALDLVRGIAVMGILAMNIVAFAMPFQAYMNPIAYGMESAADYWSWVVNFIFVDGKMRGLFSFLFGASTLIVIERARAAGLSEASVHFRRTAWLLVFGLLHFYLIWFGDILAAYALTGMILFAFRNLGVRALVVWGVALIVVQLLLMVGMSMSFMVMANMATQPGADPEMVRQWQELEQQFGIPTGGTLAEKMSMFGGPWTGQVENRLIAHGSDPFVNLLMFGWETLGYMLFGMAALKSGLLRAEWSAGRYRTLALVGFAITIPAYGLLAWALTRDGFTTPMVLGVAMAATTPIRPLMVVAYAALIMLIARHHNVLTESIAAAGRAAFTNYLGTSIAMTTLFYGFGFGLYGTMSRIELWLVVIAAWAVMLLWSKPWLSRFRYGPLEWLWRSLARWRFEPLRRMA